MGPKQAMMKEVQAWLDTIIRREEIIMDQKGVELSWQSNNEDEVGHNNLTSFIVRFEVHNSMLY